MFVSFSIDWQSAQFFLRNMPMHTANLFFRPLHEKQKNEANAKLNFEERVKESKQKAIEENIKKAEKSGNILSQTIDEQGNLIGINNVSTRETSFIKNENEKDISVADIRAELFESDNVVIGKSDYGQSELLSGPFASKK